MSIRRPLDIGPKIEPRFGIRTKILVSFLAVSLVAVGIISIFALRNMATVGNTARQNSIALGERAVAESIAALEDSGRRIIRLQALVVAKDIQRFIERHPNIGLSELEKNEELKKIAIQPVGQTGSTVVYDRESKIHFHNDPELQGTQLEYLWQDNQQMQAVLESSFSGESAGYYDVEDENGNIRRQYMYCTPIQGTSLFLAAATYIDEFSRPAEKTESDITAAAVATTEYIDRQMNLAQWTFVVIILCMIAIIATLASFMARTITDPILALTRGSGVIARGDLDHRIKVNTGDEIEQLAVQFNSMTAALQESLSNLEQKVAERTKRERQRAEQLRTINEISRNISSLMSLDELLPYVASLLRETFNYYNVNIFLFEPEAGKLILKEICLSSYRGVIPLEVPLEMGEEGLVAWVATTAEPLLVNDVSKEPRFQFIEELSATQSELAVPIRIAERVLGVLDIESNELDAFSEADLFTAQTLADQLATAIENARLYQQTGQIAVMEERNRMAREIHDTLAQGFTGIILQLEAAEQALDDNPADTISHMNKAKSLARGSLNEARRSVWNLRPEALEQLSLVEALGQEVAKFSQSSGIKAQFEDSDDQRDISHEKELALLRICQESLANVRKHAKASEVKVGLTFNMSTVTLSIRDNGIGMKTEIADGEAKSKHRGFGLISMRERTRNLGGTFEVQSEKGKGTLIKATISV